MIVCGLKNSMLMLSAVACTVVALLATPAYGQFFVPNACLTGAGFYDGELVGDVEWTTGISASGDELEITWYGEIPIEWTDGDVDVLTVTDIEIDGDGYFAFVTEDDFTGNLLDVEGFFYDDCTVAGAYTVDILGGPIFDGDFDMVADVIIIDPCEGDGCCEGDECDDDDDFDGDFCGFTGVVTMTGTLVGMMMVRFIQIPNLRRRITKK